MAGQSENGPLDRTAPIDVSACPHCPVTVHDIDRESNRTGLPLSSLWEATVQGLPGALSQPATNHGGGPLTARNEPNPEAADRTVEIASAPAPGPRPPENPPLPTVAGYRITGRLGQGGMGTVWRAEQLSTKRSVALKICSVGAFRSEEGRIRFQREVELSARLAHPHIARVYASGREGDLCYYALELIDGLPLDAFVERQRLDERALLTLLVKVCRGVQHAHQRGVIHRDLKPSNILVDAGGEPHVLDFGLAKTILDDDASVDDLQTQEGVITGTPAYMAPEQAAGRVRDIDTRTDVYTLGVILYRLLTGTSPHDLSGLPFQVLRRIVDEEVRRPRLVRRGISREIESILLKALSKEPAERYDHAGDLADDLERFLRGEPIVAHPASTLYVLRKAARKHRVPLVLATAVLLAAIGGAGFYVYSIRRERDATQQQFERAERAATQLTIKAEEAAANLRLAEKNAAESALHAREAQQKQAEAERQEAAARAARELEARQTYWTTITLASERLRHGQIGDVTQTLWNTRKDLRGWEWGYLMAQTSLPEWSLPAHEAAVLALALSADGRSLATCGGDGRCTLWDLETRQQTWAFRGERPLTALAADPGGRFFAVADEAGVTVLNAKSGEAVQRLAGGAYSRVAFVRDGELLLTARKPPTENPQLATFRTSDWQPHRAVTFFGTETATVDRGGKWAVFGGNSVPGHARFVDPESLQETAKQRVTAQWPWPSELVVDSRRNFLAATDRNALRLFTLNPAPQYVTTFEFAIDTSINLLAIDNDRKLFALADAGGTIHFGEFAGPLDRQMNAMLLGSVSPGAGVNALLSLGGGRFASAGRNGHVKCWDVRHRERLPSSEATLFGRHIATRADVAPDGLAVLLGSGWFGVKRPDGAADVAQYAKGEPCYPAGLCESDGRARVVAGVDRCLALYDPYKLTNEPLSTILGRGRIDRLAVDRAATVAVAVLAQGGVDVFDLRTAQRRTLPGSFGKGALPFVAASGKLAALLAPESQEAFVWHPAKQDEPARKLAGRSAAWHCGAVHPEGRFVAAADPHARIVVWDAATGEVSVEIRGIDGTITGLAFAPDGRRLFSSGTDRSLRVWDWELGRELLRIPADDPLHGVATDASGRFLATTFAAGRLHLHAALPWECDEQDPAFYEAVAAERLRVERRRTASAGADGAGRVREVAMRFTEWTAAHLQGCRDRLADEAWLAAAGPAQREAARDLQRHLARRLAETGRWEEALPLLHDIVGRAQDEADTFAARLDLATVLLSRGQAREALPHFRALPGSPPDSLPDARPFTLCLDGDAPVDEAEKTAAMAVVEVLRPLTDAVKAKRGAADGWTVTLTNSLGIAIWMSGPWASAQPPFMEAQVQTRGTLGWFHPATLAPRHNLAIAYRDAGRVDKQLVSTCQVLHELRQAFGTPKEVAEAAVDWAEALFSMAQAEAAEPLVREALQRPASEIGATRGALGQLVLGGCRAAQSDLPAADAAFSQAEELLKTAGQIPVRLEARLTRVRQRVADQLQKAGDSDRAARWRGAK